MYAILSGGALVALCDKPRYVRLNPESEAYIQASAEDADGIAVNGNLYNLPGKITIPDAPEAVVSEGDVSEFVFDNRVRIVRTEETTGAAVVQFEEALCEQDSATDERMSAIEDAICELDSIVNGR